MLTQTNKLNIFLKWDKALMNFSVIAGCLALVYFFPTSNAIQKYTSGLFFFLIIPSLYIKFILSKNFSDFGFNLENKKVGLVWGSGMLILSLLIAYLLIKYTDFKNIYSMPAITAVNFWAFLFYELVLTNILFFLQGFFFQGFALFSFAGNLGWKAIFAPILFFLIFAAVSGNFDWKLAPAIITIALGSIASYKSNSFIYSYIAGLFFLIFLDSYLIHISK